MKIKETISIIEDGDWYPFGRDEDPAADFDFVENLGDMFAVLPPAAAVAVQREIEEIHFKIWGDSGDDNNNPSRCVMVLVAFGHDGYASKVELSELLKGNLAGDWTMCGAESEKVALEKLRAVIDELIAERVAAIAKTEPTP